MAYYIVLTQAVIVWLIVLLTNFPCSFSDGLGQTQEKTNATRVLFVTTVDPRYNGPIFGTWMMWFLHSVVAEVDTSRYSLHLAVGCMPLNHRDSERLHVDNYGMRLFAGLLPCSYLHDIPGFEKDNNDTRFKFSVTYPNVRRMLMLQGLAESRQWDVIVYADVDAFFIRNPLPELLRLYATGKYSAAFQRDEYNSSERICNGLWAMFDMALPRHIAEHGGYGQAQINDWIRGRMIDEFVSKPTAYRTELSFRSHSVVTKEESSWRLYLLPEPQFYRGTCGSLPPSHGPVFVNHCHSTYFRAYEKELDLRKERLLLPFGSISNLAYGLGTPHGIHGNMSMNSSTQVFLELATLLHAMNQSIASLREHAGALLETYPIVATAAQGLHGIASSLSMNGSQVVSSRYLRGSPMPFQDVPASSPINVVSLGATVNRVKFTASKENEPQSEEAIRNHLLRQGHQLAQQHMRNLPHGVGSRSSSARSPTSPLHTSRPHDPSLRSPLSHHNNNARSFSRHPASGKGSTVPGSSSLQIRSGVTTQGNNYVPLPLSLPQSLYQVLTGVFPSDEATHRHRLPTDIDGYFMRDLSVVANKNYGQAYHVSIAVPLLGPH